MIPSCHASLASFYTHEKVETVNLSNGNLSVNIPLVSIGGRGGVAFTIALSYNSKLWSGHDEVELIQDAFDQQVFIRYDHFGAMYNVGSGQRPNQIMLGYQQQDSSLFPSPVVDAFASTQVENKTKQER